MLGAGASAPAIPAVGSFEESLRKQRDWLTREARSDLSGEFRHQGVRHTYTAALESYLTASRGLELKCKGHSFDEYAVDLYNSHGNATNGEYRQLKAEISTFFAIEQARCLKAQTRYHYWFNQLVAEVNHRPPTLPEGVKVLTWNYDQLAALALAKIRKQDDVPGTMRKFGVRTMADDSMSGFSILHLNGMIGLRKDGHDVPMFPHAGVNPMMAVKEALRHHHLARFDGNGKVSPEYSIRFGWEREVNRGEKLKAIRAELVGARKLVCVGYSFPPVNHTVDKALLGELNSLDRIYVQMRTSAPDIINRLRNINPRWSVDLFEHIDAGRPPYNERIYYPGL